MTFAMKNGREFLLVFSVECIILENMKSAAYWLATFTV